MHDCISECIYIMIIIFMIISKTATNTNMKHTHDDDPLRKLYL